MHKALILGLVLTVMACKTSSIVGEAQATLGPECSQLRQLDREYRGVPLTAYQKQVKAQLVSWYRTHCQGTISKVREAAKASNWN